jgi:hypothetical protein
MRRYRWGIVMESQKIHLAGCKSSVGPRDGVELLKSSSQFFLPLEGGGQKVGVKFSPLTPALSTFGKLRTVSLSNRTAGRGGIR